MFFPPMAFGNPTFLSSHFSIFDANSANVTPIIPYRTFVEYFFSKKESRLADSIILKCDWAHPDTIFTIMAGMKRLPTSKSGLFL